MRAAEALLDVLASSGNPVMFGLPGSTDAPVLDAFVSRRDVRYVLGLHESVVVGMAWQARRPGGRCFSATPRISWERRSATAGRAPVAGNSMLVEFTLTPEGEERTRLRVAESGHKLRDWPDAEKQRYAAQWDRRLAAIKALAEAAHAQAKKRS